MITTNNKPKSSFEDILEQSYRCPISQEFMCDPVSTSDGHTYDRINIEQWFQLQKERGRAPTSPVTGLPLKSNELIPNFNLKSTIREFLKRQHPEIPIEANISRETNMDRFSSQLWWKEQNERWIDAENSDSKNGQKGLRAALMQPLGNLEGNASADLVRIRLINSKNYNDADANELLTKAIRHGNNELAKLLVYRNINLTLADYTIAIQATTDPDFLTWVVDVVNPTGLNCIQLTTARYSRDENFMRFILKKTGKTNYLSIIQAIDNNVFDVFLVVLEAFSEQQDHDYNQWISLVSYAINQQAISAISSILEKWPNDISKEKLHEVAIKSLDPEVFELFLTHNIPFLPADYKELLEKITEKYKELSAQLSNNINNRQNNRFHRGECLGFFLVLMMFLGFFALLVTGILYLTGEITAKITRHSDDNVDDETHQKHANFKSAMACLVIGGLLSFCWLFYWAIVFYDSNIMKTLCKEFHLISERFKLTYEIENLLTNSDRMIYTLTKHRIPTTVTELTYASDIFCPEKLKARLSEEVQKGENRDANQRTSICSHFLTLFNTRADESEESRFSLHNITWKV